MLKKKEDKSARNKEFEITKKEVEEFKIMCL
jgi:hypothetical protein